MADKWASGPLSAGAARASEIDAGRWVQGPPGNERANGRAGWRGTRPRGNRAARGEKEGGGRRGRGREWAGAHAQAVLGEEGVGRARGFGARGGEREEKI